MKSFFVGAIGAIFVLVAAAIIYPLYSDYKDRSISTEILVSIENYKSETERSLKANIPIVPRALQPSSQYIEYLSQMTDGTIIVKAKNSGQVMVLLPIKGKEGIKWQCIGGSNKDVPTECRRT